MPKANAIDSFDGHALLLLAGQIVGCIVGRSVYWWRRIARQYDWVKGPRMASSRKSTPTSQAGLPAAEVVSFLRDTRSSPTWTEKEFAAVLNLSSEEVKQTVPVLQLAGYIESLAHGKWRTTEQGELVGGGKAARFTRESVEQALSGLKERIQTISADENAPYRITRAEAIPCLDNFGWPAPRKQSFKPLPTRSGGE